MRARKTKKPAIPFPMKLVLTKWMLAQFNVPSFDTLAGWLKEEDQEGLDENNIHFYHKALAWRLHNQPKLTAAELLEFDQNIVKHTLRLNERRITRGEEPIVWKYFQYLALLFTEIYLDRYFRDPQGLLEGLNEQIDRYNSETLCAEPLEALNANADAWPQLNKLSFWMATGAGKTLIMHANILQYQFHLEKHGRRQDLNRIILLTPNEGLSQQHLREFEAAGIQAEIFDKAGRGLFAGHAVEILEVTKLKDESGDKTVAIEAFEGSNLVLVDEGHRGASGGGDGAWMKARNALCEHGFSFEYSATFRQAVKGNPGLTNLYARNILVDYSYRYFYGDGFGKDYQILNLDEDVQENHLETYLTACLLSYFQQVRLYGKKRAAFHPFNIAKPLWIFVGGSVIKFSKKDASDILEILQFIARYVSNRKGSIKRIEDILNKGIVTRAGQNLFANRFEYLNTSGLSPGEIFEASLAEVFNAPAGGQLYVENLKGVQGEIALRIGAENEPFGIINVGDDTKLVELCQKSKMATGEREFAGSLFHSINEPDSTVNLLIGSKKFTEGWSSWRVSTMGLMNVGKGEGAQIIQLFGRGVRLKGHDMSLKRSREIPLPAEVERPKHIEILETLGIFGIHADYMAQFRDFLKEEGMPTNDELVEFTLPVIKNLGTQKLKTVRLKEVINGVRTEYGAAFRKLGPIPTLDPPDPEQEKATDYLRRNQVVLNWYPKIRAMKSEGVKGGDAETEPNIAHLTNKHIAFLDHDWLWFELERFKAERGWYNLNLPRGVIPGLLSDRSWYQLLIQEEELQFGGFDKVRVWQEIALALLKKYTERYYLFRKKQWEEPHLEYQYLDHSDPNMLGKGENPEDDYYRILYDKSQEEIAYKLGELKGQIQQGVLKDMEFSGLAAIYFNGLLVQPLLRLDSKFIEISPVPLNKDEARFVQDLKKFYDSHGPYFEGKELYLLRNLSRGKGVGFFEAANFHPDFILWLVCDSNQHVVFVDPKGLRNVEPGDPKVEFHHTIKEIENRLGDPEVQLHSYILSTTLLHAFGSQWKMDKPEFLRKGVLFMEEDADTYIETMLGKVIGSAFSRQ